MPAPASLRCRAVAPGALLGLGLMVAASVTPLAALAAFTVIAQPTDAYVAATSLFDLAQLSEYEIVTSLALGSQSVTFSQELDKRSVPASWASWGSPPQTESSAPPVLYKDDFGGPLLELLFSEPTTVLGMEVQPNILEAFDFQLNFYRDAALQGSIQRSVLGDDGARLFAASSSTGFTRAVLISDPAAGGFALAQLRFGPPPSTVPAPLPLLGAGAALGVSRRLRRRRAQLPSIASITPSRSRIEA